MRIGKMKIGSLLMIMAAGLLLLGACARKDRGEGRDTPLEAAEYTMERLKALDLKAFNECTDNYVRTYYNWLGIPREREYRVFNELLQPGLVKGKWYESNHKLAEKIVEHMAWEIKDVRQEGEKAEIDMEITNIDMGDVLGQFEIHLLENMLGSTGTGMGRMMRSMADLAGSKEELLSIMDALDEEESCTTEVTVLAYREKGQWKLHVSEEFVNAFMGNMMVENYSEDVEQRIQEVMEQYEEKMEAWGEEIGEWVEY